ncbi:uncharacterized protein METZ01_LOCUS504267, partial [marine metagenome]
GPLCDYGPILESLSYTLLMNQMFVADSNYTLDITECTAESVNNADICTSTATEDQMACIDTSNDGYAACAVYYDGITADGIDFWIISAYNCDTYYTEGMMMCGEASEINCEEFYAEGMSFCAEFESNQNYIEDIDLNLTLDSPCIDSGDPDSELDPNGTIADMGAYNFYDGDYDDICENTEACNYGEENDCYFYSDCNDECGGSDWSCWQLDDNIFGSWRLESVYEYDNEDC